MGCPVLIGRQEVYEELVRDGEAERDAEGTWNVLKREF